MKKHRSKKIIYTLLQYLCLFLPYVIILIVNHEKYFTEKNTISMGIGCVVCIIVATIVACKKIQLLKGLGGFVVLILISALMKPIINDLTLIGIYGAVGYVVSLIFESLAKHEQKYLDAYITKEVFNN